MTPLGGTPDPVVDAATFARRVHLDGVDTAETESITALLAAAQDAVGVAVGSPLIAGSYRFEATIPDGCPTAWFPPVRPVAAVTRYAVSGRDGIPTFDAAPADVIVFQGNTCPFVAVPRGTRAGQQIVLEATCGFAVTPDRLIQAVILLTKEWHDDGLSVGEEGGRPRMTMAAKHLIRQSRYRRVHEWSFG